MGAFGEMLIRSFGGDIDAYQGNKKPEKKIKKLRATIIHRKKKIHLGVFHTKKEVDNIRKYALYNIDAFNDNAKDFRELLNKLMK